ncbi:SDR family NAD(P)-dependent oxidoreductase [Photorhabdus namnaonensis]|uniref:Phthiocerol synthesis polyketide synthase type I PpsE n=1 Tax=Photorhabdus namnaonensis TaxID=1851568 RepID=A0A1B8YN04_9GAMM|nr:SDR family NAD(P)-dependent oxidoreductase [Photorhabdus namnaonensis]OCA56515.1 Phthiocerol synthesis polyketide synthase type I PpsE [Photorhabdus namnaonensis]
MSDNAIAIIGVTCRLPVANSLNALWENLVAGRILAKRYSQEELIRRGVARHIFTAKNYVPVDSCLPDIDLFDPDFFSISQREAELLDPQHRMLLECAWELAEATGYGNPFRRPRIGVFTGSSMNTYLPNVIKSECDLVSIMGTELMLTNDKDYLPARISYKLGFNGPSVAVSTGCSTSLTAVHMAIQSLLLGECEIAFAGGVSVYAYSRPGYFYQNDMIFSEDGYCRPFDEKASGTFFGDGAGLVALRPLDEAISNGDTIHAVILGSAANNDGSSRAGFAAPGVDGQRKLILDAQALAGVGPDELGMIEAHGTATQLGDSVEYAALCQAFRQNTERERFCALGSIKANVGHLAAAAGVAGLTKTIMALKTGTIAPHPTFNKASSAMNLEQSPFIINTIPINWPVKGPRRAGVSSFGAGGSNVHMILEQAPVRRAGQNNVGWRAVPLGGRSADALNTLSANLAKMLEAEPDTHIDEVVFTYAEGRAAQPYRACLYAKDVKMLIDDIKNADFTVTAQISEPQRLVVALGPVIRSALSEQIPGYWQEVDRLLAELPTDVSHNIGKIDITEMTVNDGEKGKIANLVAIIAAINCWRKMISTPIFIISDSRYDLAVACSLDMLTLPEIVDKLLENATSHFVERVVERGIALPGSFWSKHHGMIDGNNVKAILINGASPSLQQQNGVISANDVILALDHSPDSFSEIVANPENIIRLDTAHEKYDSALVKLVGKLWQRGVVIDWSILRGGEVVQRIPLPVQPLQRRRCWYTDSTLTEYKPEPDGQPIASSETADESIGVYVERWKRTQRLSPVSSSATKHNWLIFYDNSGKEVCPIADVLRERGQNVFEVHEDRATSCDETAFDETACIVNVDDPVSVQRLMLRLQEQQAHTPDHILFILGDIQSTYDLPVEKDRFPFTLFNWVKAFSQLGNKTMSLTLIGPGFVDVMGSEPRSVERTTALASIPAINQELPGMIVKVIDTPAKELSSLNDAQHIVAELFTAHDQNVVALRQGWRWERYFDVVNPAVSENLSSGMICLVTGGLGTVGFGIAQYLVTKFNTKLILLGQTPRDLTQSDTLQSQRIAQLRNMGADFAVITADVTDKAGVLAELSRVESRLGAANCFVHAAGLSGQATIQWLQNSDHHDWEKLMQPKLKGAAVLHEIFADRPLKFGCFVSSLSVLAGGLGLAPYAAANEAGAAFAAIHHWDKPYFSIDWDGWEGWDESNSFKYSVNRTRPLHHADVVNALDIIFSTCHAEPRFAVSTVPLNERLHDVVENSLPADTAQPAMASPSVSNKSIIDEMAAIWSDVLRCPVDHESNFFDLGGDSLVGAELVRLVKAHFNVAVSMVDLFESSTVASLTMQVEKKRNQGGVL